MVWRSLLILTKVIVLPVEVGPDSPDEAEFDEAADTETGGDEDGTVQERTLYNGEIGSINTENTVATGLAFVATEGGPERRMPPRVRAACIRERCITKGESRLGHANVVPCPSTLAV